MERKGRRGEKVRSRGEGVERGEREVGREGERRGGGKNKRIKQ